MKNIFKNFLLMLGSLLFIPFLVISFLIGFTNQKEYHKNNTKKKDDILGI